MKTTPAQQRMIDEAAENNSLSWSDCSAFTQLREVSARNNKVNNGMVNLVGSAQFRVARRLAEMEMGRVATLGGHDGTFFILTGE